MRSILCYILSYYKFQMFHMVEKALARERPFSRVKNNNYLCLFKKRRVSQRRTGSSYNFKHR